MVTTTSAFRTASAPDAATVTPVAAAASRSAGSRSKAVTWWPAFTRFAAIGPPMLPSPTTATRRGVVGAEEALVVESVLVWLLSMRLGGRRGGGGGPAGRRRRRRPRR